jgi:hypothetical protein
VPALLLLFALWSSWPVKRDHDASPWKARALQNSQSPVVGAVIHPATIASSALFRFAQSENNSQGIHDVGHRGLRYGKKPTAQRTDRQPLPELLRSRHDNRISDPGQNARSAPGSGCEPASVAAKPAQGSLLRRMRVVLWAALRTRPETKGPPTRGGVIIGQLVAADETPIPRLDFALDQPFEKPSDVEFLIALGAAWQRPGFSHRL